MAIKTHRVRPGETLADIAKAYYGDADLDVYIFRHNDANIYDPNVIYTGQEIIIPHLPLLRWADEG
jgi:nucleoid-associated protein YgaU